MLSTTIPGSIPEGSLSVLQITQKKTCHWGLDQDLPFLDYGAKFKDSGLTFFVASHHEVIAPLGGFAAKVVLLQISAP